MDPLPAAAWTRLRVGANWAYRGPVPAQGFGVVQPDTYSCWRVEQGWAEAQAGGRRWRARRGQWLVLPPRFRRRQDFAVGTRLLSVGLRADWASGLGMLALAQPLVIASAPPAFDAAAEALLAAFGSPAQPGKAGPDPIGLAQHLARLAATHAFASALVETLAIAGVSAATEATGDARLDAALALLAEAPAGPLDWPALAARSGLSRTHLDRICRERTGMTPRAWRDRACLRRAAALLADRSLGLAAIAARLGFHDASHFVKWHRRQAGMTPEAWRRQPGA